MARPWRTWLFVPGADAAAHAAAARSGADVLIQELEDFTPPELRPKARSLAADLYARWRKAGALVAVESGSAPYPEFAIRADAEGRVLLKLPAGQFRIGARGPRGARGTAEVKNGDSSPEAVIRLEKAP